MHNAVQKNLKNGTRAKGRCASPCRQEDLLPVQRHFYNHTSVTAAAQGLCPWGRAKTIVVELSELIRGGCPVRRTLYPLRIYEQVGCTLVGSLPLYDHLENNPDSENVPG